jgi:nucleolar protein 6
MSTPTVSQPRKKFIAFIGNLSYDTDAKAIERFLASPGAQIRLMTKKNSNESRGAAFVEFASHEELQKVLKMNGVAKLHGRTIRVELTVGGGGTGDKRKEKIKLKKDKVLGTKKKETAKP